MLLPLIWFSFPSFLEMLNLSSAFYSNLYSSIVTHCIRALYGCNLVIIVSEKHLVGQNVSNWYLSMESFFSWSTSHRLRKAPAVIQLWSHSPHFMSFSQIGTGLHSWIQDYSTLRPWSESHLCLLHYSTYAAVVCFIRFPQPNSFIYVSQCMLTEKPWKRYTPAEHSYCALKAKI